MFIKMNNIEIMTIPKVSVIIPVYNTEEYVKKAVMSIVNQTLKDIEIIVINDGSTDNSLNVVTKIAEKDNRIQIYSQENQGLSITRNTGIEKAKGNYIYFMDSDDLLDIDALECCYYKCIKNDLDLVFFDAEVLNNENISFSIDYIRKNIKDTIYTGDALISYLLSVNQYKAPVWLSFINLDYLKRINLFFYPKIIHEDELFTPLLYLQAEKIGRINRSFFKRRIRFNSIMTQKKSSLSINSYIKVFSELRFWGSNKNKNIKNIIERIISYIINPMLYNARTLTLKERVSILFYCIHSDFLKHLRIKNIIVFLFPFTICIKSSVLKNKR